MRELQRSWLPVLETVWNGSGVSCIYSMSISRPSTHAYQKEAVRPMAKLGTQPFLKVRKTWVTQRKLLGWGGQASRQFAWKLKGHQAGEPFQLHWFGGSRHMGTRDICLKCQTPIMSNLDISLPPLKPNTEVSHLSLVIQLEWIGEQQSHGKTTLWMRELVGTEFLLGLWD